MNCLLLIIEIYNCRLVT